MGQPHGIAIVGLGVISGAYLATLAQHPSLKVVAVADLDEQRADAVARQVGAVALGVDAAIAHPDVRTVLNLTTPAAHAEIMLRAIGHGKDVYTEKPLTATLADGLEVMAAAAAAKVRVGSAPDTVLGTGVQTARAAIESGAIGKPTGAAATWVAPGHESWHPNPDFYYRLGGGPMMDMGPYYLTSLVHLLGPVESVVGRGSRSRERRTIASGPRAGETVPSQVLTHLAGIVQHVGGVISTITMSFDGQGTRAKPLEVYGESGALSVPDPNHFDGEVELLASGSREWMPLPTSAGYVNAGRGIGLLDFVSAEPGEERASGALGLHVLEVMAALIRSADEGGAITIASRPARPALVPLTETLG